VPLSVPFINLAGHTPEARRRRYETGRSGCYIVPYSLLSVKDTLDMLAAIDPDTVIADECHNLKDPKTARTKCWRHLMSEREREYVAMSGTITSKGIEDFRPQINYALGEGSPLPLSVGMATAWSKTIDANAVILGDHQTGPMQPLVDWANSHLIREGRMAKLFGKPTPKPKLLRPTVSGIREAFQMRMNSAPGVVSSPDSVVKASVSIENHEFTWDEGPEWDTLAGLMAQCKDAFLTPNGDEIEHAIHVFKWMIELCAGFYNELVWPEPEALAKRKKISEGEALAALSSAKHAHKLHQFFAKEQRLFFDYSPPYLATPMQVGLAISQGKTKEMPGKMLAAHSLWQNAVADAEARHGFLVERDKHQVRVCDFRMQAAVRWAQNMFAKHGSALLWVYHREVAVWLAELCRAAGLPTVLCQAGANAEIKAQFDPDTGRADSVVIASIRAHGTGKNLQKAPAQLFVQWPRDAKHAEQTLGRVHRNRVEEFRDHVTINSMNVLPYDHVLFAACLNDAVYQHQASNRRKMVYATYDPMPRIFSPEFLRAAGTSSKDLTRQQRDMLIDKFGDDWETQI
jgi:hypothetical protein